MSGLARRSASAGPLEGSRVASKGLGALPRKKGSALAHWLWQGWPCGAAAGEGGRRVNRLEGTVCGSVCQSAAALIVSFSSRSEPSSLRYDAGTRASSAII